MPVVLTGTLRAVAMGDVGSGSCRCHRLYRKQRAVGQAALLLIFFFFSVVADAAAIWMPQPSPLGRVHGVPLESDPTAQRDGFAID